MGHWGHFNLRVFAICFRVQYLFDIDQAAQIIVASRGEALPVGRPCETTNLLRMNPDSSQQRQSPIPVVAGYLLSARPLNGVIIYITRLLANKQIFCLYWYPWVVWI